VSAACPPVAATRRLHADIEFCAHKIMPYYSTICVTNRRKSWTTSNSIFQLRSTNDYTATCVVCACLRTPERTSVSSHFGRFSLLCTVAYSTVPVKTVQLRAIQQEPNSFCSEDVWSNLNRNAGYTDWGILWFSAVPTGKGKLVHQLDRENPPPCPLQFISHSTLQYWQHLWITDKRNSC
jgi:hypothetical protein